MKKICNFIKQYKKIGYGLLTFFLIVFVLALCSASAKEKNISMTEIDLSSCNYEDYEIRIDSNGQVTYVPTSDDPKLFLFVGEKTINKITVSLAGDLEQNVAVQVYYAMKNEPFSEQNSKTDHWMRGNDSVDIYFPQNSYEQIRLDVNGEFSPVKMSVACVEFQHCYTFQWIPLIALILISVLLIIFDDKIKYFSSIAAWFKKVFLDTNQFCKEKGLQGRVIGFGVWIFSGSFAVVLFLCLLFSYISKASIILVFVLSAFTVVFQLLYRIVSGKGAHPAKLFLIVSLTIGIMYAYTLPIITWTSWDDQIHYARSVSVSQLFFGYQQNAADQQLANLVHSVAKYKSNMMDIQTDLLRHSHISVLSDVNMVNIYAFMSYFHTPFLIAFSDWLNIDIILQMILIKIVNSIIYSFVIYFGLRKLKSGVYIFSSICLLPTCLFLSATISYDYWVIAFIVYAFAVFLSEMQQPDKPLTVKSIVQMLLAMVIGCGPKAIYFALIIPFLFMSKSKFRAPAHRKKYIFSCIAVMALIAASFALPFVFNMDQLTDLRGGADVNSSEQVKYILSHPLKYTKILLIFISKYISLDQILLHAGFMTYIGNSSMIWTSVSFLLIAFCSFTDKKECDAFRNVTIYKAITFLICFAQIALCATSLYVSFTPVGLDTVNGCQWRYIIPVLFPFFYCIGSCKIKNHMSEKRMNATVFGILTFVLIGTLFRIYIITL